MTPSTELTLREQTQKAIDQIRSPEITTGIEEALPKGVSLQQFQRVASNALIENENLVRADRRSLVQSVIKCAADGLLPDGRDAALVIYKTGDIEKVQYLPMIGGIRRKLAEYGWTLFTAIVHENDSFEPDLENHRANYKPTPLGKDRGAIVGAFALAEHRDGRRAGPIAMDVNEINRVRDTASRAKNGAAWSKWYDRMAEKTVGHRLAKQLPLDSKEREGILRLDAADELDGSGAADALYGNADLQTGEIHEPIPDEADNPAGDENIEDGDWEDASNGGDPGAAFEGEEPPIVTPPTANAVDEPSEPATFTTGRYAGKTVQEIWDMGDEGHSYIKWAIRSWKTGPIVKDLKRFAEAHTDELS